ncbi:cyclase family protein [Cylindrospermum sp. FACHB-282]|uniref:cyclase family protein n=1 Tax=Cylindrospermum sp. FACHB-282 TaxID=2692794 RepID=UPI00168370AB|nr:cyclase family protein [Cylindrospermum sp. FACHB-282]MBD2387302.1 cyclase family protein [Cylindrospermum sp. FACHB-282]
MPTIYYSRVIHLSHIIDTGIPQWPGDSPVEFSSVAEIPKDGYYLRRFSLGEHSATHINAPNSFDNSGIGIDQYPAQSLVVPAVVIDIRPAAAVNFDTHGVDSGQDSTFATNHLVLAQPRIVLENLTNLDQLPPQGTTLVIGVLRLRDGSGSPAAVMAFF